MYGKMINFTAGKKQHAHCWGSKIVVGFKILNPYRGRVWLPGSKF